MIVSLAMSMVYVVVTGGVSVVFPLREGFVSPVIKNLVRG